MRQVWSLPSSKTAKRDPFLLRPEEEEAVVVAAAAAVVAVGVTIAAEAVASVASAVYQSSL